MARVSEKFITIDTETAPMDKDFEGVSPQNMMTYDISWTITDRQGRTYESRSFINADVFIGEKDLMKSSYYAEKIPQYWEQIQNGESILTSSYKIRQALLNDIKEYNVTKIFAYNARFDYGALNNTQRWETKSKYRYYFPKSVEIYDTLKMARDLIEHMPSYQKFCKENGYMTKHKTPRVQMKAETVYRFLKKDTDFVEEHKGLDDAIIESEILKYCFDKHQKMDWGKYKLFA